jgi:hypothetical protein
LACWPSCRRIEAASGFSNFTRGARLWEFTGGEGMARMNYDTPFDAATDYGGTCPDSNPPCAKANADA